jgi:hypothetical protein
MENLDSMPEQKLERWINELGHHSESECILNVFGFYPDGGSTSMDMVIRYSTRKLAAMKKRRLGFIEEARTLESECQCIFDQMPDYARW